MSKTAWFTLSLTDAKIISDTPLRVLVAVLIVLPYLSGCSEEYIPKEDSAPAVKTAHITSVNQLSAVCGGEIVTAGSTDIIEKGVCWSISPDPTVNDNVTIDGTGPEDYTSTITRLNPRTGYYVRAYATNYTSTGYGDLKYFTTKDIVIPDDTLAFYVIEGLTRYSYDNLDEYTIDSIRQFKSKLVDYIDIITYDTSRFFFYLTGESVRNVNYLLIHSAVHHPLAAVSKGEILFYTLLNNPGSSSWPYFYYLIPFNIFPHSTRGYLCFYVNSPHGPLTRQENDIRLDSTMLKILERYNKLK